MKLKFRAGNKEVEIDIHAMETVKKKSDLNLYTLDDGSEVLDQHEESYHYTHYSYKVVDI